MQATITYTLTEQAQRAQMAASGQPVARTQTITVEVPASDLDYYPVAEDGSISLDLTTHQGTWRNEIKAELVQAQAIHDYESTPDIPAILRDWRGTKQAIVDLLHFHDAAMAVWTDAQEPDRYGHNAEGLTRAAMRPVLDGREIPARLNPIYADDSVLTPLLPHIPLTVAAVSRWSERSRAADAAAKAAEAAARVERTAAEAAKEQAKVDYMAAFIAAHGTPDDKSQYADGLLARADITALIANHAFTAAGVPEADTWNDDFCRNEDCACGEKVIDSLPREQYALWRAARNSMNLPEGASVEFLRVREHLHEDAMDYESEEPTAGTPRYYARITMPHGPFAFKRAILIGI